MAKQLFTITGLKEAEANLNKAVLSIDGNLFKGVKAAGVFVQGEAQEITPQRKGVLINSAFNDVEETEKGPVAIVGYTANYAAAVHEMPDTTNFTKPGTENKFLEKAVTRNFNTVLNIIKRFGSKKPNGLK